MLLLKDLKSRLIYSKARLCISIIIDDEISSLSLPETVFSDKWGVIYRQLIISLELFPVNVDHSLPSQPKESGIGQNHHQEEIIHKLAMQLRNTGDSIDRRMVQEVGLRFPQPRSVRQRGKANRTMAVKWLGCPGINRTHGLVMSRV